MRLYVLPPGGVDLSGLVDQAKTALEATVRGCADLVANDMKQRVARGPKSGRVYEFYYRTGPNGGIFPVEKRAKPHQASAPGEAPATDSGRLVNSIFADAKGTAGYVEVRSIYAPMLEYGTRKIAPRPFMTPAVEANRQKVSDLMRVALARAASSFRARSRTTRRG